MIYLGRHHEPLKDMAFFILRDSYYGTPWIDGVREAGGAWGGSDQVFNANALDYHHPNAVALCCPGKKYLNYFDIAGYSGNINVYSSAKARMGMVASDWNANSMVGGAPFSKDLSTPLLVWAPGGIAYLLDSPRFVSLTTDGLTWTRFSLGSGGYPPGFPVGSPPFSGWAAFGACVASAHDGTYCYALFHELCADYTGGWDLSSLDRVDRNNVFRVHLDGSYDTLALGDFYDVKIEGFPIGATCRVGNTNLMYFITSTGTVKVVSWSGGTGADAGFVPRSASTYVHGQIMSTRAGTLLFAEFNNAGSEGYIIRSTDGSTWTEINVSANVPAVPYQPYGGVGGHHMIISESDGAILLLPLGNGTGLTSSDDGLTWTPVGGIGASYGYIQDADGVLT